MRNMGRVLAFAGLFVAFGLSLLVAVRAEEPAGCVQVCAPFAQDRGAAVQVLAPIGAPGR